MKKFFIILILFFMPLYAFSKNANSKNFSKNADDVFMTSLVSIKELNYKILEIQSESGYILFENNSDTYLLMVFENGENNSIVKIEKVKNSSPLLELQNNLYDKIEQNLQYEIKRADE